MLLAVAGMETESSPPESRRTRRHIVLGALTGAVVVLAIAGTLSRLIEEVASPLVLIGFAAAGAVFGALAWGAVAYDRRNYPPVRRAG